MFAEVLYRILGFTKRDENGCDSLSLTAKPLHYYEITLRRRTREGLYQMAHVYRCSVEGDISVAGVSLETKLKGDKEGTGHWCAMRVHITRISTASLLRPSS